MSSYFKRLIARAIIGVPTDTAASVIISSLAHRLIGETSIGSPRSTALQDGAQEGGFQAPVPWPASGCERSHPA